MTLLADFLSDNFRRRIRIQEAAADDQAHDLIGASVIGFGSGSLQEQALGTFFIKGKTPSADEAFRNEVLSRLEQLSRRLDERPK